MEETKPLRKDKKGNILIDFSICSCPYSLFKRFSFISKSNYNDIYWVCLQDLITKAQAYDIITGTSSNEEEPIDETVKTFKGEID